jgi:protein phosphatase
MPLVYQAQIITDRGRTRTRNEDRCGAFVPEDAALLGERGQLFVVVDGMGGHAAGDVAADLTLQLLPQHYFDGPWSGPAAALSAALRRTNAAVLERAQSDPATSGMGAAVVALALCDQQATLAHAGDCRAYRLRAGRLDRLTEDHSWVEEGLRAGRLTAAEAEQHPYRNLLTRALGTDEPFTPETGELEARADDLFLLCSDGLWGVVDDETLTAALTEGGPLEATARLLVDLALERGGPDNIAVVLVRAAEAAAD